MIGFQPHVPAKSVGVVRRSFRFGWDSAVFGTIGGLIGYLLVIYFNMVSLSTSLSVCGVLVDVGLCKVR